MPRLSLVQTIKQTQHVDLFPRLQLHPRQDGQPRTSRRFHHRADIRRGIMIGDGDQINAALERAPPQSQAGSSPRPRRARGRYGRATQRDR
ncbi:MAG: hypothetical protein MZV64_62770 [Ignavibacteriales bacterium]|nr:hypothetical protein [Ignavibacteriales bacterium]